MATQLQRGEAVILEKLIKYGHLSDNIYHGSNLLLLFRVRSSISIRNRLTALKNNREQYIKPSDVLYLYQAVVKQGTSWRRPTAQATNLQNVLYSNKSPLVEQLNELREDDPKNQTTNRVDTMLADVFSLLSLFFLTIGKGREAPATYSQIATIRVRRLLLHLRYC